MPISTDPRNLTDPHNLTAPAGGETWRQTDAWTEETWDEATLTWKPTDKAVDEPAEGAECRILVDEGEHALQVNVERRVETTENGETTNAGCYFYSPNRNYAALVVEPQSGNAAAGTLRLVPYGVTKPESGDTMNARPWETQLLESDWFKVPEKSTPGNRTGFRYGTLRFTGGADDPINDDPAIPDLYGSAYLLSGGDASASGEGTLVEEGEIAWGSGISGMEGSKFFQRGTQDVTFRYATAGATPMAGIYDAGVCYLSKHADVVLAAAANQTQTVRITWKRYVDYDTEEPLDEPIVEVMREIVETAMDPTSGAQMNTLEMVAGMSLTRGVMDEVARWQLTGPVVVQGTTEAGRDYVLGHAGLPKDQASEDVWVPFFGADSTWKFYDDTRVEGGDGNGNGAKSGLFARGVQTPGRLYLDFTVDAADGTPKPKSGNFSEQAWYRYNYEGEKNDQGEPVPGPTGMKAEPMDEGDFDHAVAFQIRLSEKTGDVTLTLDKVPTARVQTFYVEEAAETEGGPLTLALETASGVKPLAVWQRVVAAARLDVSNHGHGTAEKDWAGNALNLIPESGRHTPVHRGNSKRGAYVVGPMIVDWNFGAESSVPRLEVAKGCELTFNAGQDFRRYDTTVAAQEGAWIHHVSDAPFLGQDVELGAGSTLGFHATAAADADTAREEGVVLAGRLVLHGNATLRAEGGESGRTPRFFAVGGIVAEPLEAAGEAGQTGGVVLTVHADKGAAWRSRTAALTGDVPFGLRKTGPGTVTFDTDVPPSVTGKVTVEEGTLAVTAAADTPVGSAGLHVEADATLGDSVRMVGESRRVAIIPDGQELSGGGTVAGPLGLQSGATYVATQGEYLTVTGGLSVGDGGTADIKVTLPTGTTEGGAAEGGAAYVGDTPYLVSGVEERTVRRRFKPTLDGVRWDAIAWLQGGSTYYAAREPAMPVPAAGDLEGNETENAWHDGFEALMVRQYQSLGHAYVGATQGRTRAGKARLSASQINDALYAFSGVSAFHAADEAATAEGRTYIDAHNFYVAYEFGISRMVFTRDGARVVVEVKVQNALADTFPTVFARDAATEPAAFRSGTKIVLQAVKDGQVADLPSTEVTEVADLSGKPLADSATRAETDVRYFALPYDALEALFGDAPILLRPRAENKVELPAQQ